jgi:predicted enzyme related to lactoylglutathione lyase
MFLLNGKMVAGLGPLMSPDQPPAWSTYIATDDADDTARRVREAGGQVIVEPMDVLDAGRMAVFVDPTGAFISVWQPGQHQGADLVNEPNTFCWNELDTRNLAAAKDFYRHVFNWEGESSEQYTEWKLNGRSIAGAMEMGDQIPANVPPYWLTYFAVEDCGATVAKAQSLGGQVVVPSTDTPMGPFAVLSDPQGAVFAVIAMQQGA